MDVPTSGALSIRLFGPMQVRLGDQPLPKLRSQKGLWLLALLALRAGLQMDRRDIAGKLWPDSSEESALHNLRTTLLDLRNQMRSGYADRIVADRRTLYLALREEDFLDVRTFDQAIATPSDASTLQSAVFLRRHGALLEGCSEEWVFQERQWREQAYVSALETLAARANELRDYTQAIGYLREATQADSLRETLYRDLMAVLAAGGDYSAAIEVFRDLRDLLWRELHVEPAAETREVFDRVREQARSRASASGSKPSVPPGPFPAGQPNAVPIRSGVLTCLFTDIAGSSELWKRLGDRFYPAYAQHNDLILDAVSRWHGETINRSGDGFFFVFERPTDAVMAAVEAQTDLIGIDWDRVAPGTGRLRVRMGLHSGEVLREDLAGRPRDLLGTVPNMAARICSAAHGEQILVSNQVRELVIDMPEPALGFHDLRTWLLKGVGEVRLWQVVTPSLPESFPPPMAYNPRRHNLPIPDSPLIGRQAVVEKCRVQLRSPQTRLLTFTGFGGMGKTRTALALAESCAEDFDEGAWWIGLEEARTAEDMALRIAQTLDVPLQPQPDIREQIARYLRGRDLLLVLDKVEQITRANEIVESLLAAGPRVRCLVTTRRPLQIHGERETHIEALDQSAAIELFVERARNVRTDFEVSEHNEADVHELCQRLEGVPASIELAASALRTLTPRQILTRLPLHLKALDPVVAWSHDLLPADARNALAEMAVFAGRFSLEDAQAVCGGEDAWEELDTLCQHSLLRTETDAAAQAIRYAMLAPVRDYALARLKETPDEGRAVRLRHAERFLQLAKEQLAFFRTAKEPEALRRLDEIGENLRAASSWACLVNEIPLAAELCLAVGQWQQRRGFLHDAVAHIDAGIRALAGARERYPSLHIDLLEERAGLHWDFQEWEAARQIAEEAREFSRRRGETLRAAKALNILGLAAMRTGRFAQARDEHRRALEGLQAETNDVQSAIILNNLGILERRAALSLQGSGDEATIASLRAHAKAYLEEALQIRRAIRDQRGLAETLTNLGVLAQEAGESLRADALYSEALRWEMAVRNVLGLGELLANLAELALKEEDPEKALRCLAVARRFLEEAHASPEHMSEIERLQGEALEASRMPPENLDSLIAAVKPLPVEERVRYALGPHAGAPDQAIVDLRIEHDTTAHVHE